MMFEKSDSVSGTCTLIAFMPDKATSPLKPPVSARTLAVPREEGPAESPVKPPVAVLTSRVPS